MRSPISALVLVLALIPSAARADITIPMTYGGAFLRVDPVDAAGPPLIVTLADHGLAPGFAIRLTALGDFHNGISGDQFTSMIAVFSSSATLLDASQPDRVPDELDAGIYATSGVTCPSNLPTNIPFDFVVRATSTDVTIPAGATHLFVQANECYFVDNSDPDGDYALGIAVLSTADVPGAHEPGLALLAPWPNPGGSRVTLPFSLAVPGRVTLALHSVDGRRVRVLLDGEFGAGRHQAAWDASDDRGAHVPNGIYFARLSTPAGSVERKLVVAR